MSDLQLALIVIGVALVAAVFAYNKWQESRYRRQAESGLPSTESDVLMRDVLVRDAPPRSTVAPASAARVEPTLGGTSPASEATTPAASSPGLLCVELDYIVDLESPAEVPGRSLIEAALKRMGSLRRPVRLEGKSGGVWETLRHEGAYRAVQVGMQLVDRRGRATPEDISAFVTAVQEAAEAVGFTTRPGDAGEAGTVAARLDALCEQVDIQIVVHVVGRDGLFPGTKVRALAEAAGLGLEDDGRFRRRDEDGVEVFSMANEEATPFSPEAMKSLSTGAIALELDVPTAPGDALAFAQFREFAEQFAASVGGVLVDDNQAPLSAVGLDAIAEQLEPVYQTMQEQGIPAGGPLALRLFS
jgi:FtsZ-interacting cell division protein ZipA